MVCHHLFGAAIGEDGLVEDLVGVLHVGILEYAKAGDESRGVILEEDDLFMCLFEPVSMPETVAVSSFVSYPFSSSLFMWLIFHQSLFFEYAMDPVVTDVDILFSEDLLQDECVEWMLFSYR